MGFGFTEMQSLNHQELNLEEMMSAMEQDLDSQKEKIAREMEALGIVNGKIPLFTANSINPDPFSEDKSELDLMGITLILEGQKPQQSDQAGGKEHAKGGVEEKFNYPSS